MKTEIHPMTADDVVKFAENMKNSRPRSEEAQEVYDTLFNYFSHMIVRCRDCMYFKGGMCMKEDIRYGYVWGEDYATFEPDEDFWCKYGERRKINE